MDRVFTIDEVDELCDKAVELVRNDGFDPDLIVGITTGGAILGKIISKKLGKRFCPDYRKKLVPVYFDLPDDARKILIVDDKFDSGNTVRACFEDIISKICPELHTSPDIYGQKLRSPPGTDLRVLAFFTSGTSYLDPHYHLFISLNYELPWDGYRDNKFKNPEVRELIKTSGCSWSKDVLQLLDELSRYSPESLGAFYQNRPLEKSLLKQFSDEKGKISYKIELNENPEEQIVMDGFKEAGLISETKEFGERTNFVFLRKDNRANVFLVTVVSESKLILLDFFPDELRTFPEMCKNCDVGDEGNVCETCNSYTRSVKLLKKICKSIENKYTIVSVDAVLSNSKLDEHIPVDFR